MRVGSGTGLDEAVESGKEHLAAVGIRGVRVVCPDIHLGGADRLRPGHSDGEQVGVAKGNISTGHGRIRIAVVGEGQGLIDEAGATDLSEILQVGHQASLDPVVFGDALEGGQLAGTSALAVAGVKKGQLSLWRGHGGGDTAIETAADQDDCRVRWCHGK